MGLFSKEPPLVQNVRKYMNWRSDDSFRNGLLAFLLPVVPFAILGVWGLLEGYIVESLIFLIPCICIFFLYLPFFISGYKLNYKRERKAFNISPDDAYIKLLKALKDNGFRYEEKKKKSKASKFIIGTDFEERNIILLDYALSIYLQSITTFINVGPVKEDNIINVKKIQNFIDKTLKDYIFHEYDIPDYS
jgi:hypothetical protein